MYISDHPLSPYQDSLDKVSQYKLSVFSDVSGEDDEMDNQVFVPTDKSIVLAGMVTDLTYKLTKRGDRMATFTLESMDGTLDCVVFAKTLAEYGDNIAEEKIVKVVGRYDNSDRGAQMRVSQINALDFGKNIFIEAQRAKVDKEFFSDIRNTLIDFPGTDKVTVTLMDGVTATDVAELPMRVDSKNVVLLSTLSSVLQGRGRVKV